MMRFAKQSAKNTMTTLSFFWHKNVHFAKKRVPLYSIIHLLERDEWILLNKDHQKALKWANDKQGTLLWCKKGLVAC
jgi:hypothetical protein